MDRINFQVALVTVEPDEPELPGWCDRFPRLCELWVKIKEKLPIEVI